MQLEIAKNNNKKVDNPNQKFTAKEISEVIFTKSDEPLAVKMIK